MTPRPPLKLRIDGAALVSNWKYLAKMSGSAACGAAVKANGYGLGAREVMARLSAAGCKDFFVAHWGEAAAIADIVAPGQIAVLNGLDADDPAGVLDIGAIPVLNTPQQIARWKAAGGGRCHVMLDTGINRLGIGPEQIGEGLFDGLDIDLLMSHLASADEDVLQNAEQLSLFNSMAAGIGAKRKSFANSAGIMLGADYHFDLTRPGLSVYGAPARPEMEGRIKPVVHLSSRILQIRALQPGDPVGYNATHICTGPTRVATLSVGYADGYLRSFSGKGSVSAGELVMPVVGRVSMDLVTVDISAADHLGEGDWLDIAYDLPSASLVSGLSQYELLTLLGHRYERVWF